MSSAGVALPPTPATPWRGSLSHGPMPYLPMTRAFAQPRRRSPCSSQSRAAFRRRRQLSSLTMSTVSLPPSSVIASLAMNPASAFSFLASKARTLLPGCSALVTSTVTGTCQIGLCATCLPLTNAVTSLSQRRPERPRSYRCALLLGGQVERAAEPDGLVFLRLLGPDPVRAPGLVSGSILRRRLREPAPA